jgi:hypothetical protein
VECLERANLIESNENVIFDIKIRILCLSDRLISALGGVVPAGDISQILTIAAILLVKMWGDYSDTFSYILEKSTLTREKMAQLEQQYLKALKFKIHISQRNIYDFNTRIKLL